MRVFQVRFKTWDSNSLKETEHTWRCQEHEVEGIKFSLRKRGCTGYWKEIIPEGAPKPKSKAQIKREQQAKESLGNKLKDILQDFKDLYLEQSVNYEQRMVEANIKEAKAGLAKYIKEKPGLAKYIKYKEGRIKRLEEEAARKATNSLNWLNRANKSYEEKFAKLVDKLLAYGFSSRLRVESVASEDSRELSFLVEENGRVVHARTILAWGPIIRPHYRFITTERAA